MTHTALDRSWTIPGPGDTIAGKYVVEAERGRGGLAVVFSAIQSELDRRVAIKVLLPEWAHDPEVVERFVREGRAATRIKSEHVVHVFDVGTLPNGAPYLVLEYLEGHNLDEVLRSWGPLPIPTAIDWLLQAAEAIAEAHAHGIVHRDLKPANLFLTQHADGTACIKVIDFGLSKVTSPSLMAPTDGLTRTTDVIGSPHYMAPEQLRSTHQADARADLWALGVVLYEFLAGKPPFWGGTLPELFATVLTQPVPPLSAARANVPPAVEQAILRCLQKDPDARFACIADLARALAPYGTRHARASFDRIDRTFRDNGRVSDWSLLPPLADPPEEDPLGATDDGQVFRTPTSARVVVGSFFMLSGLFIGAFMWIYADVHAGEPRSGVTSMQPRASTAATHVMASVPPAPVTIPAPSATDVVPAKGPAAPPPTVAVPTVAAPAPAAVPYVNGHPNGHAPGAATNHSRSAPRAGRRTTLLDPHSRAWDGAPPGDGQPSDQSAARATVTRDTPTGVTVPTKRSLVDGHGTDDNPYLVPDGPTAPADRTPSAVPPPAPPATPPDSTAHSQHDADELFDGRK